MTRCRAAGAVSAAAVETERGLAMRMLLHSPKDMVAGLLAFAGVSAIVANALFLQTGQHPSPMFGTSVHLGASESVAAPAPRRGRCRRLRAEACRTSPRRTPADRAAGQRSPRQYHQGDGELAAVIDADDICAAVGECRAAAGADPATGPDHRLAPRGGGAARAQRERLRPVAGDRHDRRGHAGRDPKFERERHMVVTGQMSDRLVKRADGRHRSPDRLGHRDWRSPTRWPIVLSMRLKSAIWVAAYLRRCQTAGVFGAVRRRGAEEAGAVFVKVATLDGNATLYVPAPQTVYDDSRPIERFFVPTTPQPGPGAVGGRAACKGDPLRSRRLDRRDRRQGRPALPRSGASSEITSGSSHPCRCAPRRGARLHRRPPLGRRAARALPLVVVECRTIFGAGGLHGRAAPGRQHDQRGALAQPLIEPRQPVDMVHGAADLGLEEQQHALEGRTRHIERAHRAGERLAAGVVHDLRCDPVRQDQRLRRARG